MPESRKRNKDVYTPPPTKADKKKPVKLDSPRWLPITMVALWIIGLAWIVAWYVAPNPVTDPLGAWNIVIGFTFIGVGFFLATRWR